MPPDVEPISTDLAEAIWDPAAILALIGINERVVERSPVPGEERGKVRAVVLERFRGDEPRSGGAFEFPFARLADPDQRFRNRANPWNDLPLEPGAHLLVALKPAEARERERGERREYRLAAAAAVAGPQAPELGELKRALEAHAVAEPEELKHRLLFEALRDGKGILRRYAVQAIGEHGAAPRTAAVTMLEDAIASPTTGADDDLALADSMIRAPFFDDSLEGDEPNGRIVAALARGFVSEADPDRRSLWLRYLNSRVQIQFADDADEDWRRRRELIRAVTVPAPRVLMDALMAHAGLGGVDAELARDLWLAWQRSEDERRREPK
jgi:hypothetical protein